MAGPSGFGIADSSAYLLVAHPRRVAWLATDADLFSTLNESFSLVPSGGVRTALGAGTNADEIFLIARSQVAVHVGTTTVQVFAKVGSSTATVRYRARRYVALVAEQAGAVAHVTGSVGAADLVNRTEREAP